jgi:hypothetical protein
MKNFQKYQPGSGCYLLHTKQSKKATTRQGQKPAALQNE